MLALLLTPALASATCSGATTNTFTGAALDGTWENMGNWSGGVPATGDHVCIPSGTSVTITTAQTITDFEIDSGATLIDSGGGILTVGPGIGSSSKGTLTIDGGGLELDTNMTADAGSFTIENSATVTVDKGSQLLLGNGIDVAVPVGSGTIANSGSVVVNGSTGLDPTTIGAAVNGDGTFSNGGTTPGPVTLTGGANVSGTWQLGSGTGPDEPVVRLASGTFILDGLITDVAGGGLGHLVLGSASLQSIVDATHIHVYRFDVADAAAAVDFSPIPGTAAAIDVGNLNMQAGLLEVDAPLQAGTIAESDGDLLTNAAWSTGFFHWGGGNVSSAAPHSGSITAGTLDMSVVAGDTGTRQALNADVTATGAGTQDYPYTTGTLNVAGGALTLGNGVRWVIGSDADITGAGTIVDHGTIDKTVDAGGSTQIDPLLDVPDGTLAVSAGLMILTQPPVQYDGGLQTLTAGNWLLTGVLRLPGPITTLSTGVQFTGVGQHLEDSTSGNADALTTLTSNASGNTMTLAGSALLSPPAGTDFTNAGTINLTGAATIAVDPVKSYIQATNGAVTNLSTSTAVLTAGTVAVSRGRLSGVGTVYGAVQNTGGTVAPGNSPGTLTINGNYTQSGTGLLSEEIDGPAASQFDQLIVTGTATLGGTLLIGSTNGYQPPAGQPFDIITAGALVGTFDGLIEPPIAPYFDPAYGATAVRLTANSVSIGDVTVNEGNSGTASAVFTISLGQAAPATATVDWATQDGSAVAGSDYTAASGTVSFAPGEMTKTVSVQVAGDIQVEPTENFAVNLSNPVGTRILDANGVGTITNDDSPQASTAQVPPGDIDGVAIAPPPVQGKAVNVAPVSGVVKVMLPGTRTFVVLPDEEQVPVGTIIDATRGVVRLFAVGKNGRLQSALFYDGVFQVTQKRGQALTTLTLVGGSFAGCPKAATATTSARRRKASSSVRHLWGSGSGQFRTAGRYASATIRGTKWLTDDRCNGTLIRVAQGSVTVRDLTLNRTIVLKKPKSYLAKKK